MRALVILTIILVTLSYVRCTGSTETCTNMVEGTYKYSSRCTKRHIMDSLRSSEGCMPRPTLLNLPWPNSTQVDQMTPTHVSVNQCDGTCTQLGHTCVPNKTRPRSVPVILSKCGINSGTCDKECATIEVEEHVSCSCSCSLTTADCRLDQEFKQDQCACQCRDILGKQNCLDAGRVWDEASCSCGCPSSSLACGPGLSRDPSSCACIIVDEVTLLEDARRPRSEQEKSDRLEPFPSFQMMVIMVLLSIILILIIFVFVLLMRIQRMKRNWRLERMRMSRQNNKEQSTERLKGDQDSNTSTDDGGFNEVGGRYTKDDGATGDVNCSTPSSGFYSELGQEVQGVRGPVDLHTTEFDHLYISPEQIRNKKHVKNPDPANLEKGSGAYDSLLDSSCDTTTTAPAPLYEPKAAPAALYINKSGGNPSYFTAAVKNSVMLNNESIYSSGGSLKNVPQNNHKNGEEGIYGGSYRDAAAIYSGGSIKSAVYSESASKRCDAPNFPIDEAVRLLQQQ